MPSSGAVSSCQTNRMRAGASNATKPTSSAPVEIAPVSFESVISSKASRIPTGAATSAPRRRAGPAGWRNLHSVESMGRGWSATSVALRKWPMSR